MLALKWRLFDVDLYHWDDKMMQNGQLTIAP
jgi:hypothetical protein